VPRSPNKDDAVFGGQKADGFNLLLYSFEKISRTVVSLRISGVAFSSPGRSTARPGGEWTVRKRQTRA
jgi:hypothetical protein